MSEKIEKPPKDGLAIPEDGLDNKKRILAWSLYDWANSSFATTVMAGFFPIYLSTLIGTENVSSTFLLGSANSIASLVVLILAPILGAIADNMAGKKRFLGAFALLGAIMTGALAFLAGGQYMLGVIFYALGTIGFSGANVFYDAMLPSVASEKKIDYVSSLGFSLGYIGGGILFTLNVAMFLLHDSIGLTENQAVQWSFISVAIWWLIFSIPLFKTVPEPFVKEKKSAGEAIGGGFRQLWQTLKNIRKLKYVALFLFAYWFYIDGVDTIIRMAVEYGQELSELGEINLTAPDLVIMLLMVQFVAFPGTMIFNWFANKIGIKNGVLCAILAYIGITIFGYYISEVWHFYVIGAVVGLFQGGIQALSRSLYSRLIPKEKAGEFYGFFNMMGKFAAVLGPALMGIVTQVTGNIRQGILSILILFLVGGVLLLFVDIKKGEAMANEMSNELK